MFEAAQQKPRSPLLKFVPIAIAIFALLVAGAIYLTRPVDKAAEQLTGILRAENSDFEWYKGYVTLKDPLIQMGLNFAGNRIVMFSGVIDNAGERTLDVVEVKVQFFNYEDLVSETVRTPIRPGPYTPPISPVSQRSFNFYIEDIPEGWKSSHAEMSLNGLRFYTGD